MATSRSGSATDFRTVEAGSHSSATHDRTLTPVAQKLLAVLRILFGWIFLWSFLDKTFGLGYSTPSERAWVNGGDPTSGYLANADGTFGSFFQSLAGQGWVSWLFMLGLLGIGLALILGIGLRVAAVSGALLYLSMWFASLPLENNWFVDDHLTGALLIPLFAVTLAGDTWGLGQWWARVTQGNPILR